MQRWYAVNTQANQEQKAILNLRRQGYDAWLPIRRKTRRHARRIETIKAALFPSYLFVALDVAQDRWRPINSTFGVRRLVMRGDRPAEVPTDFVDELKAAVDESGFSAPGATQALHAGDAVRVVAGPFAESTGRLLALSDKDRVAVLLSMLGREVRAVLPQSQIAAA